MAIYFGPKVTWGGVSQQEYRRFARDPRNEQVTRLHYAALGWANTRGHAQFPEGELRKILTDKAGKQPSQARVSQVIREAKARDLIDALSGARCLVLSGHQFQRSDKGSIRCLVHGITVLSGRTS